MRGGADEARAGQRPMVNAHEMRMEMSRALEHRPNKAMSKTTPLVKVKSRVFSLYGYFTTEVGNSLKDWRLIPDRVLGRQPLARRHARHTASPAVAPSDPADPETSALYH